MAKSVAEIKAGMIAGLKEKTGKTLAEWHKLLHAQGLAKHKEMVTELKTKYSLTHGFANMIALQALQTDSHTTSDTDSLVDAQYTGAKAGLRPIYDSILVAASRFGKDLEITPKKAYVSLRRAKQFALVQPTTATRIDIGLILKNTKATARLEASGSFNAMMTHRVRITTAAEVDAQLVEWLRAAYAAAV